MISQDWPIAAVVLILAIAILIVRLRQPWDKKRIKLAPKKPYSACDDPLCLCHTKPGESCDHPWGSERR